MSMDSEIDKALGKFDDIQPPGGGNYIQKGSYLCTIDSCAFRNGYKGLSFIIELKIVKVIAGDEGSNAEGSMASFVKNLTTGKDAALSQAKGAVKAIAESRFGAQFPAESITKEQIKVMASGDQPFRDTYVYVNAFETRNQKGDPITAVSFRPCFARDLEPYGLTQLPPPA